MNRTGNQFLACPSLTQDQNSRVRRSYFSDLGQYFAKRLRCADYFLKHRRTVDLFPEIHLFKCELVTRGHHCAMLESVGHGNRELTGQSGEEISLLSLYCPCCILCELHHCDHVAAVYQRQKVSRGKPLLQNHPVEVFTF